MKLLLIIRLYRDSNGIYWGYIGITENKMETTIIMGLALGVSWGGGGGLSMSKRKP